MASNPLIALQTQSLDTATPTRNLLNMRHQKEQLDLQRAQNERQERMVDLREQKVSADIIQQRYEQMEKADKRRTRNVALGSAQLKRVLADQGLEAAKEWLKRNQEGNGRFNLPSEDTQEAMQMLESGNLDQLRTGLSNNIYIGESLGLIETPDQPAQFEPVVDDEGNIIGQRDTQTGKVVSDPRAGEEADFTARNVLLPDGGKVSGRTNEQGELQVRGPEGGWQPAPRGAQIISTSLQGSEDEIGATDPEIRNFRQLEAQMPVVNRLQDRIAEGLDSGEYVGGISGATLKGLNSLRNQAQQVYRQLNQDKPEGERDVKLSVDKFRPALGEVANMSNQVQSAVLDLAYMTLKAKDPSGRVSDKDIERELDTFGLDTSDPSIIMERVNEKIGDLYTNYRATGKGLGIEPQFQFEEAGVSDRTGNQGQPGPTKERAQNQDDPLGIRY